jgi:D-threo-aldose 1-dehydrogenase
MTNPPIALPPLGLGTAGIGNLYRPMSDAQAEELLAAAWASGIRYFDTAPFYGLGRAETRLGRFLSGLREPVLVSTKVGRVLEPVDPGSVPEVGFADPLPFAPRFDYSRDGILRSFDESVSRLGRVPDIVLIHDIGERTHRREGNAAHMAALRAGGFQALEELRASGVKGIGLGVNEVEIGLTLLGEVQLDAILLAGRHTLLDRSAGPLLRSAEAKGAAVIAAGVFNSGILATGARPGARFDYLSASRDILDRVAAMERVAARYGAPLPALALQFPKRDEAVTTVLLGAASVRELESSLANLGQPVPDEAWLDLGALAFVGGSAR